MQHDAPIDDDTRWAAVQRRDRRFDGQFVTGVLTTGIYCRPSCAARHPARVNVRFFADGPAARAAGLRPCKRCLPDDVARDSAAIIAAIEAIKASEEPLALTQLAAQAGYSPAHFQRLFTRATGLSPAAYARALRDERARAALSDEGDVTSAIYAAGYQAPSRFYADSGARLGMAPSAWVKGGQGVDIHWAVIPTTLGPMLVAATSKGVCTLAFDEGAAELAARFPNARLHVASHAFAELFARVVAAVETPGAHHPEIPIDVRGTAFQEAVWQELRKIPPGETRSYGQIAAAIGKPGAARAVGAACGANPVCVVVPCHRVVGSNGALTGYAWGTARKRELLRRERG